MAYLNLRERRIEAKIAYVGAALSGKGTNFDQLKSARERMGKVESAVSTSDDVLSLAWQPSARDRFKDCDVFVNLVVSRGALTDAQVDALLKDVDGVVVVVDAHPSAEARNRAALGSVRGAIARGERRDLPVVVQINKNDLPEALSAAAVLTAIDGGTETHVSASAVRGEGVVETAETALDAVLAALQADKSTETSKSGNGHPLLDALREVFRETVREQVSEMERRMSAQFEQALALHEKRSQADVGLAIQVVELIQETDARVQEVSTSLSSVSGRLDRLRAEREHLTTATTGVKKCVEGLSVDVRAIDGRFDELSPRLDEIEAATVQRSARIEQSVRSFGIDLTAALASTHEKIATVETRLTEVVEELKKPKKGWFT